MNYHIVYNSLAGNGKKQEVHEKMSSFYGDQAINHEATEIKSYADFVASIAPDDVIVLCGGDGTLNRFVNDTDGIDIQNEVLYYPSGTGNDFLTDLDKSKDITPFSVKEYITDLPIVEVKGKNYRFLNNVGFGIDGYCCEVGDEIKRTSTKPVNYTSIAIKGLLFHFKPRNATIVVDGKTYTYKKVWLAPTMKGRFYGGGMMAAPDQNRKDPNGKLSVMIFHGKGRLQTLMAFPSIFKGEHVKKTNMVTILTGNDISVSFDTPAAVQIDGETILNVSSYHATSKVTADLKN